MSLDLNSKLSPVRFGSNAAYEARNLPASEGGLNLNLGLGFCFFAFFSRIWHKLHFRKMKARLTTCAWISNRFSFFDPRSSPAILGIERYEILLFVVLILFGNG
jgi:hypothetical protein